MEEDTEGGRGPLNERWVPDQPDRQKGGLDG
jgi:hypothetical protein